MLGRVIALMMAAAAFAAPAFAWNVQEMDDKINGGVYVLDFGDGFCTAFDSPRAGYIVTAAHCTEPASKDKDFKFKLKRDFVKNDMNLLVESTAKRVAYDKDKDIAVLKIDGELIPHTYALAFATSAPTRGEDVYVAGSPLNMENTLTRGIMSNTHAVSWMKPENINYQIDAPVGPGNSGGPVFNDKGEVIGVVSMTITQTVPTLMGPMSFPIGAWSQAVPIAQVQAMLDTIK